MHRPEPPDLSPTRALSAFAALPTLVGLLLAVFPLASQAQYSCYTQSGASCYFDCAAAGPNFPNGAIHICSCDGSPISAPPQNGSSMGASCYNIGSHCVNWETYPSPNSCQQWACRPGQACQTSGGCAGTCVYTAPTPVSQGGGSPVACVPDPNTTCTCPGTGQPACNGACCGGNEACSNGQCLPLCGSSPYQPTNQCCVNGNVQPKFQITDLANCPGRVPRPGWDPSAHTNGCGAQGSSLPVPDSYFGLDLSPHCNAHDACYGTCNSNKATCDTAFGTELRAACAARYPGRLNALIRAGCIEWADTYESAVTNFGNDAHIAAQKASCICCQ